MKIVPKLLILICLFTSINLELDAQDIKDLPKKEKFNTGKNYMDKKYPVKTRFKGNPLSRTPVIESSEREQQLSEEIKKIKNPDNMMQEGNRIVELQKEIESTNGSTTTQRGSESFVKIVPPDPSTDNVIYTHIFDYDYMVASASQVEQRGANSGRVWVATAKGGLDTGSFASADTIVLYYSDDGCVSFNLYVKIAFSPANKIQFDDLDMEIVEPNSGDKYIYMVFGYYTQGYFGQRRIGYTIVTTPTLAVFGSGLNFPGQSSDDIFFNARICSDNARFASIPYVNIICMQDSIVGNDHYIMGKYCRILSPYSLNPAITYLSHSIFQADPGSFIDYSVSTDIANFNNVNDSILFVLSAYAGYNSQLYLYKAYNNTTVYPAGAGILQPTGDNIEYARIACSGGVDQKRMMITYSDDYLNSGDWDQWIFTTEDANNWTANPIEYTTFHDSRHGDVIARRNANGSFSIAFDNYLNHLKNIVICRFNGSFNLDSYLHCANFGYANSLIGPKPAFRYVDGDSCVNFWTYFYTQSATAGCSAINMYLKLVVEGFYDEVNQNSHIIDAFNVVLADATPPYNCIDTALVYMDDELLMNELLFKNAPDGSYYLVIKHRNAVETWSAAPVAISHAFEASYDFTTASSQAYGDNMVDKSGVWCLYTGEFNDDGVVDLADIIQVFNDASNFVFGTLLVTDINGDGYVDISDILLTYNNSSNFVAKITP